MWNRKELKLNAKASLRRYYWVGFVVCLISGILGGASGGSGFNSISNAFEDGSAWSTNEFDQIFIRILPFIIGFIIIAMIFGIVYSIFVSGPILVGKNYFFLASRENNAQFTSMFSNFRKGRYMNTVKTIFFRNLYVFLWTLLLIVPGIIKSYEYYMISFIMAENPNIETNRAFEISKYMTQGDKFNIFVLDLSFLGWYLLGLIPCGLGILFVNPYYEATIAELYATKRAEAIRSGFSNEIELCGFASNNIVGF